MSTVIEIKGPLAAFEPIAPPMPESFRYGLPMRLIAILERIVGKNTALAEQLSRERDFSAQLSPCDRWIGQRYYFGATRDQPICYEYLTPGHWADDGLFEATQAFNPKTYSRHLSHADRQRIEEIFEIATARVGKLREISQGYLGWLLTTPAFLDEHDELLRSQGEEVLRNGIPRLSQSRLGGTGVTGQKNANENRARLCDAFDAFFLRWRLESLAAPGLPVPLVPQLPVLAIQSVLGRQDEVGCMIYLPDTFPTLSRDLLRDIIEDILRARGAMPEHLNEWSRMIAKSNSSKTTIARFARLFELQHYVRILRRRLTGLKQGVLERCLAELFDQSEETIHSDVLYLRKRLGKEWQSRRFGL